MDKGKIIPITNVLGHGFLSYEVCSDGNIIGPDGTDLTVYANLTVKLKKRINREHKFVSAPFIIATAFVPNPNKYKRVKFVDGNTDNLHYTNLQWVKTTVEAKRSTEEAPQKVTKGMVVNNMLDQGLGTADIMELADVTRQFVNHIKRKRTTN